MKKLLQISETRGIYPDSIRVWRDYPNNNTLVVCGKGWRENYEGVERLTLLRWLEANSDKAGNIPQDEDEHDPDAPKMAQHKFKAGTLVVTLVSRPELKAGTVCTVHFVDHNADDLRPYQVVSINGGADEGEWFAEDEIGLAANTVVPDGAVCVTCGKKAAFIDNGRFYCGDHWILF